MHYYETKFIVEYTHYTNNQYSRYDSMGELDIAIIPVLVLFEIQKGTDCGIDARSIKEKVLVIDSKKWSNIALTNIYEINTSELLSQGAQVVEKSMIYDDAIDASIQVAFVCSKYMIEPNDVYAMTNGILTEHGYKKLLGMFYDDFPEKYI